MSKRRHSRRAAACFAWGVVLALVALIASSLLPDLRNSTDEPSGDEIYYLRYLQQIGAHGLGAFPELFRTYLGDSANWIFPPPSRVGFVLMSALWSKVFGADRAALTYLSLASHLALVIATFVFARRWLGELDRCSSPRSWRSHRCSCNRSRGEASKTPSISRVSGSNKRFWAPISGSCRGKVLDFPGFSP